MKLSKSDYYSLVYARCNQVTRLLSTSNTNEGEIEWGAPQPNRPLPEIPDFEKVRTVLNEILEIVNDFETSVGPA